MTWYWTGVIVTYSIEILGVVFIFLSIKINEANKEYNPSLLRLFAVFALGITFIFTTSLFT